MVDTPHHTMTTVAVHEALIQRLVDGQSDMIEELRAIGAALVRGDARTAALETAQAACTARHDTPEMIALRSLPSQVAVMGEQLDMIRKVVYGGVAFALIGLLTTLGVVIVKVLGQP